MSRARRAPRCIDHSPRIAGYTLVELLVVLAILAAVIGLSWPVVMRQWSRNLVQQAAQQLRQEVLDTRIKATEECRVYRLRWRAGTGEYQIDALVPKIESASVETPEVAPERQESSRDAEDAISVDSPNEATSELDEATDRSDLERSPREQRPPAARDLENGVRFADPLRQADSTLSSMPEVQRDDFASERPGQALDDQAALDDVDPFGALAGGPTTDSTWSDAIWFYPDGRTSNSRWTLVSDQGYEIDIRLRGLTGTVRVGPIRKSVASDELLGTATDPQTSSNSADETVEVNQQSLEE